MVKGLDMFLAHFRAFNDRFVLISGTACDIALREISVTVWPKILRDLCAERKIHLIE